MTTRLVLYLTDHWPQQPLARWTLLDATGALRQHGESEPRHWPAADSHEAVLGGTQCTALQARLPRAGRRDLAALLRYALEDRLLADGDDMHLTPTGRHADGDGLRLDVIAIARKRLRTLHAQFGALGRPLHHAGAALQMPAAAAGRWQIALGSDGCAVVAATGRPAFAIDAELLPAILAHTLHNTPQPPTAIDIHAAAGITPPDLSAFGHSHGIDIGAALPWAWWTQGVRSNLLHGEFPRHATAGRLSALRAPAVAAAAAAVLFTAITAIDVGWQGHRLRDVEARIARVFETALPGTPAIAPEAQLQRQLDDIRATRGHLRGKDMLALAAGWSDAYGQAASDALRAMRYRDGTLELQLHTPPPAASDGAAAVLSARGIVETRDPARPDVLILRSAETAKASR